MHTKAEALETLRALPLKEDVPVSVLDAADPRLADVDPELHPRAGMRVYRHQSAESGITTLEISADPTPEELEQLSRTLPLAEKDRAAAAEEMKRAAAHEIKPVEPVQEKDTGHGTR